MLFRHVLCASASQGSGIGRLVLAEVERIARDEWRWVAGNDRDRHPCRIDRLYETPRLCPHGHHACRSSDDDHFGLPQRDDLRFEYLTKALA